MGLEIEISPKNLTKEMEFLKKIEKGFRGPFVRAAVMAGATPVVKRMKTLAPREFGILKNSINKRELNARLLRKFFGLKRDSRSPDQATYVVGPNAAIGRVFFNRATLAYWNAYGVRPHAIGRKGGRMLNLNMGNPTKKFRRMGPGVWHPGIRGSNFMERAMNQSRSEIHDSFNKALGRKLKPLGFKK